MKSRREVLLSLAAGAATGATALVSPLGCQRGGGRRPPAGSKPAESAMTHKREGKPRMPVIFVGHGSPMNLLQDNQWSRGFAALRSAIPSSTARQRSPRWVSSPSPIHRPAAARSQ